jgi:hypothetical protein
MLRSLVAALYAPINSLVNFRQGFFYRQSNFTQVILYVFFSSGYYCPSGQTVRNPSAFECPAGHLCITGSSTYRKCPSGSYQDEVRQSTCKTCLEGFYCDNSLGPIVNVTQYDCPVGHYCPNGTQTATEWPCPAGTFNNGTGLRSASECLPCLGEFLLLHVFPVMLKEILQFISLETHLL